ncbi:MAG TPA: hypothetical protein ENN85_04095 [Methanoculleus sp.]|nr:hypothetical protein [Methanoculleus sp.]
MILLAGITRSVHLVLLAGRRRFADAGFPWATLFFSFEWPSVVNALDILAWDVVFALSMLFAAPVFPIGRLKKTVRIS